MSGRSKKPTVEVLGVRDVARCRAVMNKLLQEEGCVAVDAEGVDLGETGRLTIMQIARQASSGGGFEVYIIDVVDPENVEDRVIGNRLLTQGGVAELLQSAQITKIMQSCGGDSAALYHQFGITLKNVFDTQVANQVIERKEGVCWPIRLRLDLLQEKYGTEKHDSKDSAKEWLSDDHAFFLRRPLTAETIDYISQDVVTLFQLYEVMDKMVTRLRASTELEKGVWEEIYECIDPKAVRSRRNAQKVPIIKKLVNDMNQKYSRRGCGSAAELDDDERKALYYLSHNYVVYTKATPLVKRLHALVAMADLEEYGDMYTQGEKEIVQKYKRGRIQYLTTHPDPGVQQRARQLLAQISV